MKTMTPEQRAEWRRVVELEQAAQPEETARWNRIAAAAREPGFSGDLRRALLNSGRKLNEFADAAEVPHATFLEWMGGEASVPSEAVDRLVEALGLRLSPVGQA